MMKIFKTFDNDLKVLTNFDTGIWINMVAPTENEINVVCSKLNIDTDYVRAALDEEERARIENENGRTLILIDVPISADQGDPRLYTTLPLAIIIAEESIVTVCLKETSIIRDFIENRIKSFFTFKKARFILQVLFRNATYYLQYLRQIDKESNIIEGALYKSMRNKELLQLLKLEKSLVYFSTSLKSNEVVLEKLLRFEYIKKYPEDTELLEDTIVENKQAIEMANIYSSILSGTMDAFASIISNNVNFVMKFLTSVTIVMAIPTMVASFFGMNVGIPLEKSPYAFIIVIVISLTLSALSVMVLAKRKLF